MALIKCPNCGEQISDKATVCPKCGKTIDSKSQKKTKKEIVNLGIVIAFVAGILVGGMSHALLFNSGKSDDKVIQTEQKESVKTSDKELSKDTTVESNNNENKSDTIKEVAINEPMNITHEYGNYILTEITAPDGYKIANPIEFVVTKDGKVKGVYKRYEKQMDSYPDGHGRGDEPPAGGLRQRR